MGYIESWGRGIDKICDACEIAGLQKSVYDIDGNGIMLQIKANVDWDGISRMNPRYSFSAKIK